MKPQNVSFQERSRPRPFQGMSRSHLFLMELIVVILFFAFAGAITVQVFAKAHELARDTEALNGAILAVQSAAETDKTAAFGEISASRKSIYFDVDWKVTDSAGAVYVLTSEVALEERPAGAMAVYHYTVTYGGAADAAVYAEAAPKKAGAATGDKIIYELDAKKYYPGEVN